MSNLPPELLAQAEPIFHEAVHLPPDQQSVFLDLKCVDNPALRTVLNKLLSHAEDKNGIFTQPENPLLPTLPKPGTQIGRYQLISCLGRGGMGQVFLARQEEPQRDVAIKLLRADFSDKSLSYRFKLEIEILGRFNHPGIAQIYEAGTTEEGHSYFVMEYVPGQPLTQFVTSEGLDPRQRLELAIQVCEAVQYAHEQGIIHRDLKPSNIMATRQDDGIIRTRVLDFGVARATGTENPLATLYTIPGQLVGTLAYMSPEQVSGHSENLDARSDIFQLGVIIYELLAGRLPLDVNGMGFADAMRRINEDEPVHLGTVDTFFRGDIETIISKAMAKDRELRYCTAGELAQDIRRYLDGEAILARPTTTFYRLGKVIKQKRNSILSLAAMAVVTSLVAWFFIHEPPTPPRGSPRLTRLTAFNDQTLTNSATALSPDGKQLAYAVDGDVLIRNMETGESTVILPKILDERRAIHLSWYPSGKELLMEFRLAESEMQLARFNLDSQTIKVIRSYESVAYPTISPNGKMVLFLLENGRKLSVLDLESGEFSTVLQMENDETIFSPVWGPDNYHLAFARWKDPLLTLECTSLSGGTTILGEDERFNVYSHPSMAWLPDGRLIHVRNRDLSNSGVELLALPMDVSRGVPTGESLLLHAMPDRAVMNMTYCPASNSLVFQGRLRDRKLVLFDVVGEAPVKFKELPTRGWPCFPISWSSDGKFLVMNEVNSTREYETLIMNMATGDLDPLPCSPKDAINMGLTPDGEHVVVRDGTRVVAVPLDCSPIIDLGYDTPASSSKVMITRPNEGCGLPRLIAFEGADIVIREISLEDGVGPELMRINMDLSTQWAHSERFVNYSFDVTRVAYSEYKAEIKILDLATEETNVIPTEQGPVQIFNWSWDDRWIYCVGNAGMEKTFWMGRVDPISGQFELLWNSNNTLVVWPFPSPDGKTVAAQILSLGTDFFMLEGL